MNTLVVSLLKAVAGLLLAVQGSSHGMPVPSAVRDPALALAAQAVQLSVWSLQGQGNPGERVIPNIVELRRATYTDRDGMKITLQNGDYYYQPQTFDPDGKRAFQLIEFYTSFGDMNGDGFDDAAAIIRSTANNAVQHDTLVIVLSAPGGLINIANADLGFIERAYDHHVLPDGTFRLDYKPRNEERKVVSFKLIGTQLVGQ